MLSFLFVATIFAGGVVASMRRPYSVVCLAVFLAPWEGLAVDVGVRITAYRLVITAFILTTAVGFALRRTNRRFSAVGVLGLMLVGYVLLTTILQLPLVPDSDADDGMALRFGWYRPVLQTLSFMGDLGLVYAVSRVLVESGSIWRIGKLYVKSCLVLAALGWFQLAAWYAIGWNPLPIDLVVNTFKTVMDSEPHVGVALHEGIELYRMNSLGWEPRNMAVSLAIALLLLQSVGIHHAKGRPVLLAWGILFLTMFATLATSGVVLWAAGTLASFGFGLAQNFRSGAHRPWPKWGLKFVVLGSLAMILAVLGLLGLGVEGEATLNMLMLRGRAMDRDVVLEDFDEAVVGFLADMPSVVLTGVGLGNVHLYAESYLPTHAQYALGSAFRAKSGALFLMSELGLVGCLLFSAWYVVAVRRLITVTAASRTFAPSMRVWWFGRSVARFTAVMYVLFLLRGHYVGPQLLLALAAAIALTTRIAETHAPRSVPLRNSTRMTQSSPNEMSQRAAG